MRGLCLFLFALAVSAGFASAKTPDWDRAHELYQRTEYAQALSLLDRVPNKDADTLQLIGQCHLMQADYKQAGDAFEKALALAPRSSELHRLLGSVYGRRAETGSVFTAAGNARKARQYFEQAVELDPNNREAAADLFEYYLEAPSMLGGGIDKAENLAKRIVTLDAPAGYHALAQLERKQKRYDEAEAELRRAVELEKSLADPGAAVLPQNRFVRVVTKDGTTVTGRLMNQDTFTLQMIDSQDRLRSFPVADLRQHSVLTTSSMPSYKDRLNSQERADVIAYLVSLKGARKP